MCSNAIGESAVVEVAPKTLLLGLTTFRDSSVAMAMVLLSTRAQVRLMAAAATFQWW